MIGTDPSLPTMLGSPETTQISRFSTQKTTTKTKPPTSFLDEHVQQLVAHLPVADVAKDARQRTVPGLVDRAFSTVLQQEAHQMQHVPLVPLVVAVPVMERESQSIKLKFLQRRSCDTNLASSSAYRMMIACSGVLPIESGVLISSLQPRSSSIRMVLSVSSAVLRAPRITKEKVGRCSSDDH